jgi:hypothetical protein
LRESGGLFLTIGALPIASPVSKCRKWSVWREALGLEKFAENHDIYKKKGLLEIKEIRREAYKADNKWFIDYLEIQASKKRN